ncbi:hypothetical protein J40TS1_21920 [Paenibacillus montaniterrae]|uniref:Uncharacterized protein n=1 Tax=Paenibacillus montaniterrae TaxID=429341 RepID=A0A920CXP8_9BACL|nr:DUF5682 family protein [Paenibacillus montaniterrae]GIP16550.1 hypothetical protein J40TS1_21920 [Paenibacillus montaniterrae]
MSEPVLFGVRHLSPAGSWHLLELLNRVQPEIVLVEGPSDLTDQLSHICAQETKPPIAIMAYSETVPIRTILYPFAVYSPEYQAIKWAHDNGRKCRFIDLPSSVFLAIQEQRALQEQRAALENARTADAVSDEAADTAEESMQRDAEPDSTVGQLSPSQHIAEVTGEDSQETFWERHFEHNLYAESYLLGAAAYGSQLRGVTNNEPLDEAENILREAYMKHEIEKAIQQGIAPDKIVVVTGAYHVDGLRSVNALTEEEIASLPKLPSQTTLMPYSYYRLSSRSGYGAGNKAPAYYELLWNNLQEGKPEHTAYAYMAELARYQRKAGHMVSAASVIEAVRLSQALASMKGFSVPSLRDLRDSAVTCIGHGNFSEIALAVADTEIGTKLGSLPEGVSRTSIQADFYRLLKDLKLEKYRTTVAQTLELDLRENMRVKSEKAAFLDLSRSFFLHRLQVLGISFAKIQHTNQDKATWAEHWNMVWSVEAEIELVESALRGETVELAAAFALKERIDECSTIDEAAAIIEAACLCGMPASVKLAVSALQRLAVDAVSIKEIAQTVHSLSAVIRYGNIRRLDYSPLVPIVQQLFLRACLIMADHCNCDNKAAGAVIDAIAILNEASLNHDFTDGERWIALLAELSDRDDINTKVSGFAAAILLERGMISNEQLAIEVERRLSKGIPADLGAAWFEGLALKNKYALIARLSLWEKLSQYLDTLDREEFKRALVFLRRSFSSFTAKERSDIAENLAEVWGLNAQQVDDMLNRATTDQELELIEALEEFDFDDI